MRLYYTTKMKRVSTKTLIFFVAFFLAPLTLYAGEISYGTVQDVKGLEAHIKYKSPMGEQNFICDVITSACIDYGTTTPTLFPSILGVSEYTNSPDGSYALVIYEGKGTTTTRYLLLYNLTDITPQLKYIIPFEKELSRVKFTWESDVVVLFSPDGEIMRFSIADHKIATTTADTSLPLRSLSPHGKYLSSYSYTREVHRLWEISTGELRTIPGRIPAFVEFSQDETYAIFIDKPDGFETLYTIDLSDENSVAKRIFSDDFTVIDYLFLDDDIYFVANKEHPLKWSLFRYSLQTKKLTKVADNVSYNDYIRPIAGHMSFLTINGKNTDLSLYNPKTGSVRTITPVEESPSSNIKSSILKIGDLFGVLMEPSMSTHAPQPLFIWLHGGPKRQTSLGYHSYLSYAVYDELLERLTQNGAYVLKLDYTGSYGYGDVLQDGLQEKIGVADVADVIQATNQLTRNRNISDVYLIGNSYGGYLSLRVLVERPELFTGAVSINGVFDWFTLLERIPSSPFKEYFNGTADLHDLDYNFTEYLNASIYTKLGNLNDQKIVLIYGEEDSTVPTWQTREFFYLAKGMEKNVSLLSFPDEGHILRQRNTLDQLCTFIGDKLNLIELRCVVE